MDLHRRTSGRTRRSFGTERAKLGTLFAFVLLATVALADVHVSQVALASDGLPGPPVVQKSEGSQPDSKPMVDYLASEYDLSESEASRRLDRQDELGDAIDRTRVALGESLFAVYVDHTLGGAMIVSGTDSAVLEDVAAAERDSHPELEVRVREVLFSRVELDAVQERIEARLGRSDALTAVAVGIDVHRNKVIVTAGTSLGPEVAASVREAVAPEGDMAAANLQEDLGELTNLGCTTTHPTCDDPLRGGPWISPLAAGGPGATARSASWREVTRMRNSMF